MESVRYCPYNKALAAVLTESGDDCEGEQISDGEQALYASRSAFRR